MRMEFRNQLGSIKFGDNNIFSVIDIDGLGFLSKNRNMTNFSGVDGQFCLGEYIGARTITIKGDFVDSDNIWERKAVKILNSDGEFIVGKKSISAVCSSFEISKKGGGYKSFILQLTADYPYFRDNIQKSKPILKVYKLIKSSFQFPLIMSKRECSARVYNGGDTVCEPILEITAIENTVGQVIIENITYQKSIILDYQMEKGEVVTVDVEKRTINSSINGNVLFALTDDSFLSDFILPKGENELKITNQSGGEIVVECKYKNKYVEAI